MRFRCICMSSCHIDLTTGVYFLSVRGFSLFLGSFTSSSPRFVPRVCCAFFPLSALVGFSAFGLLVRLSLLVPSLPAHILVGASSALLPFVRVGALRSFLSCPSLLPRLLLGHLFWAGWSCFLNRLPGLCAAPLLSQLFFFCFPTQLLAAYLLPACTLTLFLLLAFGLPLLGPSRCLSAQLNLPVL